MRQTNEFGNGVAAVLLNQFLLRHYAPEEVIALQGFEECRAVGIAEVELLGWRAVFVGDAVDATVGFVTVWTVDFASVEHDQVVPIEHVDCTVGANFTANRGGVLIETSNKISLVACDIATLVV